MSLPNLDTPFDLPPACVEEFREKGHTVVRGLASQAEVDAYAPAIVDTALAHNPETRPIEERETYGKAFLQTTNLWRRDETVKAFVFAKRFAKVAAELLGSDGVRLYHDQALFKEAGGGFTPWHQDQVYWPFEDPRTITMWMPLVDVPAEVGSMTFASGSHRAGDLGGLVISDQSEAEYQQLLADRGLPLDTHGAMKAGDATFHAGWMLHRAGPNPTDRMRSVMTVIYMAADIVIAEPASPYQRSDTEKWLAPCGPGEVPTGPTNPVLWSGDVPTTG